MGGRLPLIRALGALLLAAWLSTDLGGRPAFAADPGWYRKKKDDARKEAEEAAAKEAEMPIVGEEGGKLAPAPASSELGKIESDEKKAKAEYPSLLFKREGVTASLTAGIGSLSQPEIQGFPVSLSYAMGWWWKPDLVLSGFGRAEGLFSNTFNFLVLSLGPQLRWFATRSWAFTGNIGYAFSEGLSRVGAAHIPPPPRDTALTARRGLLFTAQAAYLFWNRRDLAVGPTASATIGSQGERSYFEFMLGFTYQDGRPNYTGDLTE